MTVLLQNVCVNTSLSQVLAYNQLLAPTNVMIYWTLKSIPELAPLPRKKRRRVHQQCLRHHFWGAPATRRSVAAYFAMIMTVTVVVVGGDSILSALGIAHSFWTIPVLAFIGVDIGSFIFSRVAIPAIRPFYREFIETDEEFVG